MNIIKLQDMLRGVPDDALIGYVQNPQGQVPSYLALSELQRRKDTRAKYESEQAPESSVAEDISQQAQPSGLAMLAKNPQPGAPMSQGVADLPTGDMFQEQNFAGGGIVAFDDGGQVKNYAGRDGSYVYSTDYDPVEQYRRARQLGTENLMARKYGVPTTSVTKAGIETPYDDALSYYEGLRKQAAMSGKGLPELSSATNALQKRREAWLAGSLDPYSQASPVGSKPNLLGNQPPVVTSGKPSNEPDVKLTGDSTQNAAKQPYQGVGFDGSFYDKMLKKEKTLQELSDEYKAVLGTDPTLAGRQEKLAKMEARAKRMEDMAPGMAMLEAGLGIAAGTSPFALTNIGKGAMAGVKSYGEAQNKLADLEEKRFALDTELAKQQRAEQMAAITFGDRSRQHTEEMNKTVMLNKAKDKLARDEMNLRANVELSTKTGANAPKIKEIAEARAAYQGSKAQNEVKKALLKKYGDNAEKPTSDRHAEFMRDLKIAEEQYLANYFAPIGSNMPRASTQGFEITKPKK
jgi:hypothetical protein